MKKIVINLPKGFRYKIKETEDTLEIDIEPVSESRVVKRSQINKAVGSVVTRDAATGKFVAKKPGVKRTAVKAHKRTKTGGTGPRKKK